VPIVAEVMGRRYMPKLAILVGRIIAGKRKSPPDRSDPETAGFANFYTSTPWQNHSRKLDAFGDHMITRDKAPNVGKLWADTSTGCEWHWQCARRSTSSYADNGAYVKNRFNVDPCDACSATA
jgi:hypothetical protein